MCQMPGAYGTLAGVGPTTHNDACEGEAWSMTRKLLRA
jgi:hypothetical protein